jgi:hypothetical protein
MSDAAVTPSALPLGIITDYQSLHAILRARADALRLSRQSIDGIAGFADGYASKLLSPSPVKILGERSLGPLLTALGIKLAALEDPDAMARFPTKRERRAEHQVRRGMQGFAGKRRRRNWLFTPETAREAALTRMSKLSAEKRRKLARRAARARWRRVREARAQP